MSNEIANVGNRPADLPAHIPYNPGQRAESMVDLLQYVQPPRLKIIQSMTKQELKQQFNEGDLLVMPSREVVAPVSLNEFKKPGDEGTPFHIVPVFFYTEYVAWNPLAAAQAGQMPFTRERSFDKNSKLAQKCRTPNMREEPCSECPPDAQGNPQKIRNQEHLNFLVALPFHPTLYETPVLMSFSRGEFGTGCSFSSLLSMRGTSFDCYYNQFVCYTKRRTNAKGNWFGFNIVNPAFPREGEADMRYVSADLAEYYKQLYQAFKEKHAAGLIVSDYEDDEVSGGSTVTVDPNAPAKF